ncbi:DUF2141 domain-containing protein [Aulosira sp. FACHB-615]|uniref:DUF2141 domain-containing protein n=1 Tax=Aulosira sp. FACHB-615 TaxID=2692777 RepID=UPI0016852953|nr:DUF2141 domain-containing protein [Aulosira sp. FACHB-615]MBD2489938.1 DUF2141 domain-containing protein [Aulosira sp. FACHB-615]
MRKIARWSYFVLSSLISLYCIKPVTAEQTATLTIVVKNVRHQKGDVCFRIYAGEKGFPMSDKSEVQSGCAKITGNTVVKKFSGLKHGTYAVAIVDDQNGDRKLNTDFFGIPKEGFGISKNPTVSVQTGTPKFRDASFVVNKNTSINIVMKYSLDP